MRCIHRSSLAGSIQNIHHPQRERERERERKCGRLSNFNRDGGDEWAPSDTRATLSSVASSQVRRDVVVRVLKQSGIVEVSEGLPTKFKNGLKGLLTYITTCTILLESLHLGWNNVTRF